MRQPAKDEAALRFATAAAAHRDGRLDQAEAGYRAVLRQVPRHGRALQNLGALCRATDRRAEALGLYRRALAQDPGFDDVRLNLGNLLNDLDRHGEAETMFRHVLQRRPDEVKALFGLGYALLGQQRDEAAVAVLGRLAELAPGHRTGLRYLAATLDRLGRAEASLAAYERLLALDPADPDVRYLVDARRGRTAARAPASFVTTLFDSFAPTFENSLRNQLDYRTPELLAGLLDRHAPPGRRLGRVVDLGCGTGLMGPLLRPRSEWLEGVDLSAAMLGQAAARSCYDGLHCADIVDFMQRPQPAFDLAVAADVFVYLGDLAPILTAAAARLATGGMLLFSVELADAATDWRLQPTARFAHGPAYLARVAEAHGLAVLGRATAAIRQERGCPVPGGLYLLHPATRMG